MNIIELKGTKTEPDIIHEYPKGISESSIPLVIDNGNLAQAGSMNKTLIHLNHI